MRRLALATALVSCPAAPALAQSQVQHVTSPTQDTATANGPLPGASDPSHPPTPNPAGPIEISRRPDEPPLPIRPALPDRDQLSGHFRLAATIAFGTFTGDFSDNNSIGSRLGGSPLAGADLGFGITRQLELVLSGDYSTALAGSTCEDCGAVSWSLGPMLRFHLVEGTRFSPWLALGAAYRRSGLDSYRSSFVKSVEFLRVQFGGDWYATSSIALGPILGCGIATSIDVPANDGNAVSALFYGGLRLTFDLPGR